MPGGRFCSLESDDKLGPFPSGKLRDLGFIFLDDISEMALGSLRNSPEM